jgi:protein-tyrosine-phosphatase/predicted ATP-grasp superfamily ATP-dependent carboligase
MSAPVLVLGDDDRSCLTIVRSLGRHGLDVWLATENPDTLVRRSRYARRTVLLPSTRADVDRWAAELEALLRKNAFDLVIPCSDNVLVPVVKRRAEFEALARFALPDDVGFEHTYSKDRTLALADRLDVPTPGTRVVRQRSELAALLTTPPFPFPLVVKPNSSKVWKDGKRQDLRVRTVADASALEAAAAAALEFGLVLVQRRFPGVGVGQEFLASQGEILAAFQHERVHEPRRGGGSSYRKSADLDERMLACSKRLLGELRWTGVAMVEYKQDPETRDFVLMEINGRFWGSLPLAVAAGVDFPYYLHQLLVRNERPSPPRYRAEVYARNVAKDLAWFSETRREVGGAAGWAVVAKEIARGARNAVAGREHLDTLTRDDPAPALAELGRGIAASVRKNLRRTADRARRLRFDLVTSSTAWRRARGAALRRSLRDSPRIVFLCRGNICRSPFAEALAKKALDENGPSGIETSSAGTYPVAGRSSPPEARIAAQGFGLSLDEHRSRILDEPLVRWAGAVVCMDRKDARLLADGFPGAKEKTFFLGTFGPERNILIDDPWGKPLEEYRRCYERIRVSVNGLVDALRRQS